MTERGASWQRIWRRKGADGGTALHHLDGFDGLDAVGFSALVDQVASRLPLAPGVRLIELGCGAGAMLAGLLSHEPGLVLAGVDYADTLLAVASDRLRGTWVVGDISRQTPFPDASFDVVLSYGAFLYLDSEAHARGALAEMARLARPGATVLVGEVSDARRRDVAHRLRAVRSNRARVSHEDPDHLYLHPHFFSGAADLGLDLVEIVDHAHLDLPGYDAVAYRYTAVMRKRA